MDFLDRMGQTGWLGPVHDPPFLDSNQLDLTLKTQKVSIAG